MGEGRPGSGHMMSYSTLLGLDFLVKWEKRVEDTRGQVIVRIKGFVKTYSY